MRTRAAVRGLLSDASGAVADLGVLVPIAATLVLKNGLDPATVLACAGLLYVAAGTYFGVPFPVQPIKAAAAIAIARGLPAETIAAAGIGLGAVLVILSATGATKVLERVFARPIVRGLQLGVGLILVRAAYRLGGVSPRASTLAVAVAVGLALVVASRQAQRFPVALALVAGGVLWSLVSSQRSLSFTVSVWDPRLAADAFRPSVLWSAFTLLVIPQIPLTLGNAVIALTDVEHRYFGARSERVTSSAVGLSCGLANIAAGALGGMPMCHGSGGLTAHVRAGAQTSRMNLFIGGALLVLGVAFGPAALSILALIPVAVLMGFLAFTGVMHAALVADLSGSDLATAIAMGALGFWTSNLALALALGIVLYWPLRALRRG